MSKKFEKRVKPSGSKSLEDLMDVSRLTILSGSTDVAKCFEKSLIRVGMTLL